MKPIVVAGVLLGLIVDAFAIVTAAAGLHRNPLILQLLFVAFAIVVNVVTVIGCLRHTRKDRGYGGQVFAGVLVGAIGSVLIFTGSMLLTTVLFPDYLTEVIDASAQMLRASGLPPETVDSQIEALRASATPLASSLQGVFGTMATSLVISLIAAAFLRKK